jgi:hypothetical protein
MRRRRRHDVDDPAVRAGVDRRHATPPPAAGVVTVTIPTLKAATTYDVAAKTINFAHASCYVQVSAVLGSFTTR